VTSTLCAWAWKVHGCWQHKLRWNVVRAVAKLGQSITIYKKRNVRRHKQDIKYRICRKESREITRGHITPGWKGKGNRVVTAGHNKFMTVTTCGPVSAVQVWDSVIVWVAEQWAIGESWWIATFISCLQTDFSGQAWVPDQAGQHDERCEYHNLQVGIHIKVLVLMRSPPRFRITKCLQPTRKPLFSKQK